MDVTRSSRFPIDRFKLLLRTRPFDTSHWSSACGPYLHLRIANMPVVTGKDAALVSLQAFIDRTVDFGCAHCDLWQRREAIVAETDVQFRDGAGASAQIPCVVIARTTHGLIQDLRLYLDPAPLLIRSEG